MGKKKRKSGIELLRIIIMFQIIILHLFAFGGLYDFGNHHGGVTNFLLDEIWSLCRMPVNVFMLITGYFMVNSEFNLKKVFNKGKKLWLTMLFYSLLLTAVYFTITQKAITVPQVFKAFMPFFSREWYFLCIYLVILFLSPFVNIVLQQLNKKQYLIFAGIIFMVVSVWSTLAYVKGLDKIFMTEKVVDTYMGKSIGSLFLLYVIGGYLRRFSSEHNKPQFRYLALYFAFSTIDVILFTFVPQYGTKVFGMFNNPLVIGASIAIFLFFRDINFSSSFVNTIAGTTLGIYAIHENPYMRELIWKNKITEEGFLNFSIPQAYIAIFVYCIIIFVVCCLADLLRQKLFDGISYLYQKIKNKKN